MGKFSGPISGGDFYPLPEREMVEFEVYSTIRDSTSCYIGADSDIIN